MKNLNLFILSITIIASIGANNTFGYEGYFDVSDQDTNDNDSDIDISDIDTSKINASNVILSINDKKFNVTTKDTSKYPVLTYFAWGNTEIPEIDILIQEFYSDFGKLKNSNDSNNSNLKDIFFEIKNYIVKQSGLLDESVSIETERLNNFMSGNELSFYQYAQRTLLIDGKKSQVSTSIVNKYPVLKEFTNSESTFSEEYNFDKCIEMAEKLNHSIAIFKEFGTSDEAHMMKNIFLEIRSAIENAIRKLKPVNSTEAHEMTEYTRNILPGIIEEIESAYKEASQR